MQDVFFSYLSYFHSEVYGGGAIILWVFAVSNAFMLAYYLFFYVRILAVKEKKEAATIAPVSVIIASRDDAKQLRKNLPQLMAQEGVVFEVIVVDDCSYDDTADVLIEYAQEYPHFRHSKLVENGDFEGGKKYAVTIGIKAAKYEHLVLLDADCAPEGKDWLKKMASHLMYKKVVLGYGPYRKTAGLLNMLIRYDTYKIAQQYLSYAAAGIPYMGVGRNLAYHQYLYFESKGFTNHLNVVSGDDDLFINEVSTSQNTGVEIGKGSFVYSEAKTTYTAWEFQKRRHLTTGSKYKWYHVGLLGLQSLVQYVIVLSFITLLFYRQMWPVAGAIFGARILVQSVVMGLNMRKLKVLDLLWITWLLDPLLLLFYLRVGFLNIVKRDQRKRWV